MKNNRKLYKTHVEVEIEGNDFMQEIHRLLNKTLDESKKIDITDFDNRTILTTYSVLESIAPKMQASHINGETKVAYLIPMKWHELDFFMSWMISIHKEMPITPDTVEFLYKLALLIREIKHLFKNAEIH